MLSEKGFVKHDDTCMSSDKSRKGGRVIFPLGASTGLALGSIRSDGIVALPNKLLVIVLPNQYKFKDEVTNITKK